MVELSTSTPRSIRGSALRLNDIVIFRGHYRTAGRVVRLSQQYAMILDELGRLSRVRRMAESYRVQGRWTEEGWRGTWDALELLVATRLLLRKHATRQALALAATAPSDPADYDQWRLPLIWFADFEPLSPMAADYYAASAYCRRRFEATIEMMKGPRQREAFVQTVIGHVPTTVLRDSYHLCPSAIRTARWRAIAFFQQHMPHAFA